MMIRRVNNIIACSVRWWAGHFLQISSLGILYYQCLALPRAWTIGVFGETSAPEHYFLAYALETTTLVLASGGLMVTAKFILRRWSISLVAWLAVFAVHCIQVSVLAASTYSENISIYIAEPKKNAFTESVRFYNQSRSGDVAQKLGQVSALKESMFFGAAGMEGRYIDDMIVALEEHGIGNASAADSKKWS